VRLLLVEDETRLAAALQRGLSAEGFVVDVAADGLTGLQRAATGGYDAVILDIMLPVLSGYEVIRRLRAQSVETPVLVLSAKDGEYDQADGLDEGADDYLTKPFSFVVLVARLRALLRRGGRVRAGVLQVDTLTLDPAARQVTMAGRSVELTAREFALLEYLMQRAGEVVPKAELYAHVWDALVQGDLNVVEVYVGYLRRKLGPGVLETVRGAGYRLAQPASDAASSRE